MIKRMLAAVAAAAVLGSTGAALAAGWQDKDTRRDQPQSVDPERDMVSEEERVDEVAGIRIVPSVVGRDVHLAPSKWYLRGAGRNANANAKVYTNQEGAITGVTVTSWGLPNPETINPRYNDYVVWLVDTDTNDMKNIGVLESRNAGKAVFGFSPDEPLVGYDRIMITPESTFATGWPEGWEQLDAELPRTAMAPTQQMPRDPMIDQHQMPRNEQMPR